ncbi:MAG: hypothetical protein KGL35_28255 [Bradyrhizobium sp.]|nr:hypothetical protein [Bradyrhizobium sp.]
MLVAADIILAVGPNLLTVMIGAVWGLHMGMTQGLLAALLPTTRLQPCALQLSAFSTA